jgi:hypothetical protein
MELVAVGDDQSRKVRVESEVNRLRSEAAAKKQEMDGKLNSLPQSIQAKYSLANDLRRLAADLQRRAGDSRLA